jgi:hypothetical protein
MLSPTIQALLYYNHGNTHLYTDYCWWKHFEATHFCLYAIYIQANLDGPEFASTHQKTEQAISVEFAALEILLHQGAILSVMEFAQRLQPPPSAPPPVQVAQAISAAAAAAKDPGKEADTAKSKEADSDKSAVKKRELFYCLFNVLHFHSGIHGLTRFRSETCFAHVRSLSIWVSQVLNVFQLCQPMKLCNSPNVTCYPLL